MSETLESVARRLRESSADELFPTLTRFERDSLAKSYLDVLEARIDRDGQKVVEKRAASVVVMPEIADRPATGPSHALMSRDEFYAKPESMYDKQGRCRLGSQERKTFRSWCGRGSRSFADWLARAEVTVKEKLPPESREWFDADWHEGGPTAYYEAKRDERIAAHLSETIAKVVAETKLELTMELLASEFALYDDSRVTWGEATIEDHERRAEFLRLNSAANVDAESLHRKAIEMLREAGAGRLSELSPEARAA